MNLKRCILPLLLIVTLLLPSAAYAAAPEIPDFDGAAVIELNHNVPALSPDGYTGESEIRHSRLPPWSFVRRARQISPSAG